MTRPLIRMYRSQRRRRIGPWHWRWCLAYVDVRRGIIGWRVGIWYLTLRAPRWFLQRIARRIAIHTLTGEWKA